MTYNRDKLRAMLREAGIENPGKCSKCGRAGDGRVIIPHVEDRIEDAVWMCVTCYRVANPPAQRRVYTEYTAKCPPYEVMKADYLSGMTYAQMGAKYGVRNRANVHRVLKDRAVRRGEWPLRRDVPAFAIWATVREQMRRVDMATTVYVSNNKAATFAPFTKLRWSKRYPDKRAREVWPAVPPPAYHQVDCLYAMRTVAGEARNPVRLEDSASVFALTIAEAEDWGYRPCLLCCNGQIKTFAEEHGFNVAALERINQGDRKTLDYALATRLLEAVGERVPSWMRGK